MSIQFQICVKYETKPGEEIFIYGDSPDFGNWKQPKFRLKWSEGHIWKGDYKMSTGSKDIKFKFVCHSNYSDKWEEGENRLLSPKNLEGIKQSDGKYILECVWNHFKINFNIHYIINNPNAHMQIIGDPEALCHWQLEGLKPVKMSLDENKQILAKDGNLIKGFWTATVLMKSSDKVNYNFQYRYSMFDTKTNTAIWEREPNRRKIFVFSEEELSMIDDPKIDMNDCKILTNSFLQVLDINFVANLIFNQMGDKKIYIGPYPQTEDDFKTISESQINTILNLQTDKDIELKQINHKTQLKQAEKYGILIKRYPILDFSQEDLENKLKGAGDLLNKLLKEGRTVYVHCTAGMSRAAATVIIYLVLYENFNVREAIDFCKKHRPVICPNYGVINRVAKKYKPGSEMDDYEESMFGISTVKKLTAVDKDVLKEKEKEKLRREKLRKERELKRKKKLEEEKKLKEENEEEEAKVSKVKKVVKKKGKKKKAKKKVEEENNEPVDENQQNQIIELTNEQNIEVNKLQENENEEPKPEVKPKKKIIKKKKHTKPKEKKLEIEEENVEIPHNEETVVKKIEIEAEEPEKIPEKKVKKVKKVVKKKVKKANEETVTEQNDAPKEEIQKTRPTTAPVFKKKKIQKIPKEKKQVIETEENENVPPENEPSPEPKPKLKKIVKKKVKKVLENEEEEETKPKPKKIKTAKKGTKKVTKKKVVKKVVEEEPEEPQPLKIHEEEHLENNEENEEHEEHELHEEPVKEHEVHEVHEVHELHEEPEEHEEHEEEEPVKVHEEEKPKKYIQISDKPTKIVNKEEEIVFHKDNEEENEEENENDEEQEQHNENQKENENYESSHKKQYININENYSDENNNENNENEDNENDDNENHHGNNESEDNENDDNENDEDNNNRIVKGNLAYENNNENNYGDYVNQDYQDYQNEERDVHKEEQHGNNQHEEEEVEEEDEEEDEDN